MDSEPEVILVGLILLSKHKTVLLQYPQTRTTLDINLYEIMEYYYYLLVKSLQITPYGCWRGAIRGCHPVIIIIILVIVHDPK